MGSRRDTSVADDELPFAGTHYKDLLRKALDIAGGFLDGLADRPVGRPVDFPVLLERMGGPLAITGEDPARVIEHLANAVDPGLVATAGPRYFGFVTGGSLPVAVAAEWLASVWDQNAFNYLSSPAAAAAEEVARQWLVELFGLSPDTSAGFTTGATMASFTALAAARHALLRRMAWDVEVRGLFGAPPFTVVTSEESHVTILAALQMLGLGRERVVKVPADCQGRMRTGELRSVMAGISTPVLVCAQAGNGVKLRVRLILSRKLSTSFAGSRSVAPCGRCFRLVGRGIRAVSAPSVKGIQHADSITTDGHKWLNVPYDCGAVFVRDRAAHHAAMTLSAPYYGPGAGESRARATTTGCRKPPAVRAALPSMPSFAL